MNIRKTKGLHPHLFIWSRSWQSFCLFHMLLNGTPSMIQSYRHIMLRGYDDMGEGGSECCFCLRVRGVHSRPQLPTPMQHHDLIHTALVFLYKVAWTLFGLLESFCPEMSCKVPWALCHWFPSDLFVIPKWNSSSVHICCTHELHELHKATPVMQLHKWINPSWVFEAFVTPGKEGSSENFVCNRSLPNEPGPSGSKVSQWF